MKKIIRERINKFSTYDFDNKDRKAAIQILNDHFDLAENAGWKNVVLEHEADEYDSELILFGEREETDKEVEARLKLEEKLKEAARLRKERDKKRLIERAKKLGMKFVG